MKKETFPEQKEKPSQREVEIYMVRHGKQEKYDDPHSHLSEEGREQARQFAREFLSNYVDQDVIIKVMYSPIERAASTGEEITNTLREEIESKKYDNIKLYTSRLTKELRTTGALGPVMKSGVDYFDAVDEWLENIDKYPESKKPKEVVNQVESMINFSDRLTKRLPDKGPKIVYIWVTHETAHAAMINKFTGKPLKKVGGGIGHLEPIKITTDNNPDTQPNIAFRGKEYHLTDDIDKKKKG